MQTTEKLSVNQRKLKRGKYQKFLLWKTITEGLEKVSCTVGGSTMTLTCSTRSGGGSNKLKEGLEMSGEFKTYPGALKSEK